MSVEDAHKTSIDYDKEKYKEMILDAAETVLGHFGFDKTVYGDSRSITPRKWRWLGELRQQRKTLRQNWNK